MVRLSSPNKSVPKLAFRPDIEGLRGIAILLVVAYHAGIPGVGGGYIGVDVFFVLSGYLITQLLVHELEVRQKLNLLNFYARRARRLLPALTLVLLATLLAGLILLSPFGQRSLATSAVSTAAYLSNLYFAYVATDYLAADADTNPLLHTWSLSVEEQFYLVWPLLVMLSFKATRGKGARDKRITLMVLMTILALSSFGLSLWLTETRQPWAFFSSPTRAWEFAVGGFTALLPIGNASLAKLVARFCGWAGLGGIIIAAFVLNETTAFPGFAALLPVVATSLVLYAGMPGVGMAPAILNARALRELGRLSYSWYLWHWPVLVFGEMMVPESTLAYRLFLVGVALLLSELSYRLVENPVRHHRWLAHPSARALGLAALLTLMGLGSGLLLRQVSSQVIASPSQQRLLAAQTDTPSIYGKGCVADFFESALEVCRDGEVSASNTVVLFGDSHAAHWFPAVEAFALSKGWTLVTLAKSACPPADVEFHNEQLGRTFTECTAWRSAAFDFIATLAPRLVVISSSLNYEVAPEQWREGTARTLARLSETSGTVAILRDTPRPGFDAIDCLSRAATEPRFGPSLPCTFTTYNVAQAPALERAAAQPVGKFANVVAVDMTRDICKEDTCEVQTGELVKYRDSHHLTAAFAASLAPALTEWLEHALSRTSQ